jgi:hypothetical protein
MSDSDIATGTCDFRLAIEAHDFAAAGELLQEIVGHFRSRAVSTQEIQDTLDLLKWAIDRTRTQKARLSEELLSLKRCLDAYAPPRRVHTWRIEG